jgi:iron(III) transport system permease protein
MTYRPMRANPTPESAPTSPMQVLQRPLQGALAWSMLALALLFVALPVLSLLVRSLYDAQGEWVGANNFIAWLGTSNLQDSAWRSLRLSAISATVTVAIAFGYAYSLTMSAMRGKTTLRLLAMLPLLAPSLLMAISLVYLFGNQGLLKGWIGGSIYGERGIVLGSILWTFPHAMLILLTALSTLDGRLLEAARTLGAPGWRVFLTVVLPAVRYSVLMAWVVVFVLVLTDFGVPKVIGGQASVLSTDLYKQVVGQQNFSMGAVVSVVLLLPAVAAFFLEQYLRARQSASLGARSTLYEPQAHRWRDRLCFAFCLCVAACLIGVIGVAVFASLATYWPYQLQPSLKNYNFDQMDGGGWGAFFNSLHMAFWVALVGSALAFVSAWMVDKMQRWSGPRQAVHLAASIPMAVPGLSLGLGYIFFFNQAGGPLGSLYGTMTLLVACTIAHFYSVAHFNLLAAMRQLDKEFEMVAQSMGVPFWTTLWRVYLPVCLPAIFEVAGYFFVNALTTVSAVVFLYTPNTQLASVAVLNMDDAGDVAPAAAMAVMLFIAAGLGRLALQGLGILVQRRTQRWRSRDAGVVVADSTSVQHRDACPAALLPSSRFP